MSYLDEIELVNYQMDAKCSRGWTGAKGNCKRVKKKKTRRKGLSEADQAAERELLKIAMRTGLASLL